MDILTLVKANIRHRKSTFISILVLMFIISMALTLILSVNKSCIISLNEAYSSANSGNVMTFIKDKAFTDELREKLDNNDIIDHYQAIPMVVISNGMETETESSDNSCYLSAMRDDIKLINKDFTGYETTVPPLSKGEIYLSYGSKSIFKCDIGDKITAHSMSGDYEFTIKGFVTEPMIGAMPIGWKWQFISHEDLDIISAANARLNNDDKWGTGYIIELYKTDDCGLSDGKFRRQINLDTDIISNSWGSLTKEMSMHYTNIYSDNVLGILLGFILILAIVVLIVIGHSISTGIELDYTNLGVLKSQGFSSTRIRFSILLQYIIAEIVGSIIGVICALPFISVLTGVFDPISGHLTETKLALGQTILYLLGIIAVSIVFIILVTRKICNISPIRAISGGRNEIYFDSRLRLPISAGFLSSTLALRQFTSAKRRYFASIIIAAILIFFMLMVNTLCDATSSRKALKSMGMDYSDITINFKEKQSKDDIDKLLEKVSEHADIQTRYFSNGMYISINGDEIHCSINFYPEDILVTKGRAPIYDNEIVITDIVADELDLKIGDSVDLSKYDNHSEFIVSGIYPSLSDTGMAISINGNAGEKLGIRQKTVRGGIELKEPEKADEIKEMLENEYGENIEVSAGSGNDTELYDTAIKAVRIVIYSFSLFFALVVVSMVSSKTFTQEKTDIGIFKSQGFTTSKLRLQFAVRFLIVSLIGTLIGTFLGILFTSKLLTVMLRGIGITTMSASFTLMGILIPAALICICFFLFALLVSGKIKKVGIRQLISE